MINVIAFVVARVPFLPSSANGCCFSNCLFEPFCGGFGRIVPVVLLKWNNLFFQHIPSGIQKINMNR